MPAAGLLCRVLCPQYHLLLCDPELPLSLIWSYYDIPHHHLSIDRLSPHPRRTNIVVAKELLTVLAALPKIDTDVN